MSNSGRSNGSFYPARPYEEVEKPVRAVRFPVFHAAHGVVAHGRGCVGVRTEVCAVAEPPLAPAPAAAPSVPEVRPARLPDG